MTALGRKNFGTIAIWRCIFKLIQIFKELAPKGTKIQKFKQAVQLSLGKLYEKTIR